MAEPQIHIGEDSGDVEMTGEAQSPTLVPEIEETAPADDAGDEGAGAGAATAEDGAPASQANKFLEYLKSPIVELVVGHSDEQTVLTAHQAILTESPYFAELVEKLGDVTPRRISLEDESIEAVSSFLQYQYTGEYFPRRQSGTADGLEADPSIPDLDDTGDQLLRHAKVYTLAQKLGVANLQHLAHSKIHRINSTARGEISYARYVYANTEPDDSTIRKPVAAFWATRSHVLRHEAEKEFRSMCLEFPQFGFDVLSLVLDQREKKSSEKGTTSSPVVKAPGRKRVRMG